MSHDFRLYPEGDLYFVDERIESPITFAHVADLHLSPPSLESYPECYRPAIEWYDRRFGRPHRILPRLLDEICDRGVDFVFFGGDNLDVYHSDSASLLKEMCIERGLKAYFQIGNHDWNDANVRFVTNECDLDKREVATEKLVRKWGMPGRFYAFEHEGVLFIALDTPYIPVDDGHAGFFDEIQSIWFIDQLSYDGPIVVFNHIPFLLPTFEPRLRKVFQGRNICIAEDQWGTRVRSSIENNRAILGIFAAHLHFRSEDPLGRTWQFIVAPPQGGQWRYVKIAKTNPPKSLRASGEPIVEPSKR